MGRGNRGTRTTAALLATCGLCLASVGAAAAHAVEPRIVGGTTTTIEEWPWQVAIADPPATGEDGYDRQFCGGSLVAPTVVLTAAHCVYDSDSGFQPPSAFSVITGRTTLSSSEGAEIPAVDLFYFVQTGSGPAPQSQLAAPAGGQLYDEASSVWDVALLELASAAPAPAEPIQIASPAERNLWEPGDPAYVTGWGSTATAVGAYRDDLHEAEIEIGSDEGCGSLAAYGSDFDATTMVCAGEYPEGGEDTCQGDSGGPLVVPADAGAYRLVGDTSWGTACALPTKPGVYGRVADEPLRTPIVQGIALAQSTAPGPPAGGGGTGGGGAGGGSDAPPGADTKAPETEITASPKRRTTKRKARFEFTSDEAGSRFECKLDAGAFAACDSPYKERVKRGRHRFMVRAIDVAGNADATPGTYRWKVRRRR